MTVSPKKTRRTLFPAAIALAAAGLVVAASAATLGGINSDDLGADDGVVASCDTDGVDLAYTTVYDATDARYEVSVVEISDIAAACALQDLSLTLADGTGVSLGSGTLVVGATGTESVTMTPNVSAEAIEAASVVISG